MGFVAVTVIAGFAVVVIGLAVVIVVVAVGFVAPLIAGFVVSSVVVVAPAALEHNTRLTPRTSPRRSALSSRSLRSASIGPSRGDGGGGRGLGVAARGRSVRIQRVGRDHEVRLGRDPVFALLVGEDLQRADLP